MNDDKKPVIQYDRNPQPLIARGQFRILLILIFVQIVMNAQTNYAPTLTTWVKDKWAEHQAAIAHAADVKKQLAIEQRCLAFVEAPDKIVWEEDPVAAEKLLAASGYAPISDAEPGAGSGQAPQLANFLHGALSVQSSPLQQAVMVDQYQFPGQRANPYDDVVFMHGRKSPAGGEELVMVAIDGGLWLSGSDFDPLKDSWDGEANKAEAIVVSVLTPLNGESLMSARPFYRLEIIPRSEVLKMPAHWTPPPSPQQPGTMKIDYKEQLRVYAGQPDATDEAHFTIAYTLDGKLGTIDGWLRDDGTVRLVPRIGKVLNDRWYPHAQ